MGPMIRKTLAVLGVVLWPFASPAATLLFSDDFESGNLSAWDAVSGVNTITTTAPHSGTYAVKYVMCHPNSGCSNGNMQKLTGNQQQIYVKFWWKPMQTWAFGSGSHFWRIGHDFQDRQMDTSTPCGGWNNGVEPQVLDWGFNRSWRVSGCAVNPWRDFIIGQWNLVEMHFKLNDNGSSNGILRGWVNGVEKFNHTGEQFRNNDDPITVFHLNSNFDPHTVTWYFDDVEIWDGLPTAAPPFTVDLTSNKTLGSVPLAGVQFTATVPAAGTGPDYQFLFDCNNDGTAEQTVNVDDDATPGPVTSNDTLCDAAYQTASPPGGFPASVTVRDCANTGAATCVPVATVQDFVYITVNGQQSQCPAETQAASAIVALRLIDATDPDSVLDADFKQGDTIAAIDRDCVELEADGNTYLDASNAPGSVLFYIDGNTHCESNPVYAAYGDSGNNFQCNPWLATPGEHTIVVTPYDQNGCDTTPGNVAGPLRSFTVTTL